MNVTAEKLLLFGRRDNINKALKLIEYVPPTDFFGETRINISVTEIDIPETSGLSLSASATLNVTIVPDDDAPQVLPYIRYNQIDVETDEDSDVVLDELSIADVDVYDKIG